MNPATDYIMTLDELELGGVNRCKSHKLVSAGKGVNVSAAFERLGVPNVPIVSNVRRLNVKLHCGDSVTEINADSCADKTTVADVRLDIMRLGLKQGDWFIIGGSLPDGVPANFYAQITNELTAKGVKVIVDTSGEPLRQVVKKSTPWLIAPNKHEFAEIADLSIKCNTLVSHGEKGARLTVDGKVYTCEPPKVIKGGYTVGAGDNLLAGFVAEYIKSKNYEKSLIAGVNSATQYIENHGN